MDDEIERLVVRVRADTQGFARDVAAMKGTIDGPLQAGAERAGRGIETALARAIRTGKLGFDDLRKVALGVLSDIAASAVKGGIDGILHGGAGGGLSAAFGKAVGLPGRATGGPVSPDRAYLVGERGPELFVPTASGRVLAEGGGGGRDVRVAITVNGGADSAQALARSSRQVARAVRAAIDGAGG